METEFTSLVENAFDFVERSMDDLEAGRPKYSVINFYSGVELFLKARLLKEHWALCASNVSKMAKSDFASGGFESIGLNDAKDRLSNIVGCSLPKAESSVYEKLRKRRNQAVHFYHPDDLRSEKKVAVEQLSGWHFLRKRLSVTWKDCFESFAERIDTLHRRMIGREDYYPAVYGDIREAIQSQSKNRLIATCRRCAQHSALTTGPIEGDLHLLRCAVCETESAVPFLPCDRCGKLAPQSTGPEQECQWCDKPVVTTVEQSFDWARKVFTPILPEAWCGCCGYTRRPSVIVWSTWTLCLTCLDYQDVPAVEVCEWCGDLVTGLTGDIHNPGCVRCHYHIEFDSGSNTNIPEYLYGDDA